jgi:hypothetical protein
MNAPAGPNSITFGEIGGDITNRCEKIQQVVQVSVPTPANDFIFACLQPYMNGKLYGRPAH